MNNGVSGVGSEGSLVALYEDDEGDRGMLAVQDIPPGQQLVRLPLRLAITDVMEEQQAQQLAGQGALWQDRLVAKLLQQVQQGRASPWHNYLQALPRAVPSALQSFGPAEATAVQLPAVASAIRQHAAKMSRSWADCRPDAIGGADLATYRWAHSVVMSRTFGNAAQHGGIGVRMLVPLIDMLNHAGDETDSGLPGDSQITARDNVRWDVVAPSSSPDSDGAWSMVLSAKQAIPAGSPLLLSYFEGSNDEFLLHYGFVPPANPHDTVQLFPSITAALEALWHTEPPAGEAGSGASQLAGRYKAALEAGLAALQEEVAAAGAADSSSWGGLLQALEPVQVASGGRVSSSLVAALESLHDGDMAAVEAAVAGLAWSQLARMPTSLLHDLALLVADCQAAGDAAGMHQQAAVLKHYSEAMLPGYAPEAAELLASVNQQRSSSGSSSSPDASSNLPSAPGGSDRKKRKAVPLAAAPTAQAWRELPLQALVDTLAANPLPPTACVEEQQPPDGAELPLSHGMRCAVRFRASKKMLLMDVVLAARVPLPLLQLFFLDSSHQTAAAAGAAPPRPAFSRRQQHQTQRQTLAHVPAAAAASDGISDDQVLPWDAVV